MNELGVGLMLAVVASLALNSSYLLQHRGAVGAPAVDPRHPLRTLRGLLASRLWALGALIGMTGWALHVAALTHAPLSLVQAFVAGGLGLMAPVAARLLGQQLSAVEWLAVAGIVISLVMLSLGLHDPGRHARASGVGLTVFVVAALAVAGALSAWVRGWRAHALGLAGGILYGAGDTAIKALTGVASAHGVAAVLSSGWLAAALIATAGAFFCFQRGLQTGRAIPVVVLMTGATTAVSVIGGFTVFGDPLGRTPVLAVVHLAGFALVTLSAALLAPAAAPAAAADEPRLARRRPRVGLQRRPAVAAADPSGAQQSR